MMEEDDMDMDTVPLLLLLLEEEEDVVGYGGYPNRMCPGGTG